MMNRLPAIRIANIGVWTVLATGWTAAGIALFSSPPAGATQSDPPPGSETVTSSSAATIPAMPEGGLVVVRHRGAEPSAQPEAVVVRRVVVEQAPAPAPAPVVQSQGS